MQAGRMNQRCSLKRPVRSVDALGSTVITWADAGRVWCSVWPMSGSETREGGGTKAVVNHEVRMRRQSAPTLAADWRIVIGSRVLEIQNVLNVESQGAEWRLACVERPA